MRGAHTLCMFVGYPRSGHSLVGHLLNNHSRVVMAHEFPVPRYLGEFARSRSGKLCSTLYLKIRRHDMLYKLLDQAQSQTRISKTTGEFLQSAGHEYRFFGEYEPARKRVLVLGNKGGGKFSLAIHSHGVGALDDLMFRKYRLRFLHVVRNPYDIVATMAIRIAYQLSKAVAEPPGALTTRAILEWLNASVDKPTRTALLTRSFDDGLERFCRQADGVKMLKACGKTPVLDVHFPELLKHPRRELSRIMNYLEVQAEEPYYRQCAAQLGTLHRSRALLPEFFDSGRLSAMERRLQSYPWFRRYHYADEAVQSQ